MQQPAERRGIPPRPPRRTARSGDGLCRTYWARVYSVMFPTAPAVGYGVSSLTGAVPGALIDADHAAVLTGDAAVGKEVGRVGKDQVNAIGGKRRHDFQAIGLIDADVMFGVVEGRLGQRAAVL